MLALVTILCAKVFRITQELASSCLFNDCLFISCYSSSEGGAIFCSSSINLTITSSIFYNCSSASRGGSCCAYSLNSIKSCFNKFIKSKSPYCGAISFSSAAIDDRCTLVDSVTCAYDSSFYGITQSHGTFVGMNSTYSCVTVYDEITYYNPTRLNQSYKFINIEHGSVDEGSAIWFHDGNSHIQYANIINTSLGSKYGMLDVSSGCVIISNFFSCNCSSLNFYIWTNGNSRSEVYDSFFDRPESINADVVENCEVSSLYEHKKNPVICNYESSEFTSNNARQMMFLNIVLVFCFSE